MGSSVSKLPGYRYKIGEIVRTQHLNEFFQQWQWIIILDYQKEKADMNNVVFSSKVFGELGEGVKLVHTYIAWQPFFWWTLRKIDVKTV